MAALPPLTGMGARLADRTDAASLDFEAAVDLYGWGVGSDVELC
jgi:hypothetical protein